MRHLALPWLVSSCFLLACADDVTALPAQAGHVFHAIQGTSPDDVWAFAIDEDGAYSVIVHGALGGELTDVIPVGQAGPWSYARQLTPLSKGRLLLVDAAEGEPIELTTLNAAGATKTLDTSQVFADLPGRLLDGRVVSGGGRTFLVAWCTGVAGCASAQRLAVLKDETFVEVPNSTLGWQPLVPLAVIGGELWLQTVDSYGRYFLKPTSDGWRLIRPPTTFQSPTGVNFAFTAPDDVWFDGAHFDGAEWSLPLRECAELLTNKAGGILPISHGVAAYVELRRVGVATEPGSIELGPVSLALDVRQLTHAGQGAISTREVAAPACDHRADCLIELGGRFDDGTLWFLVGDDAATAQYVLPVRASDL